MKTTTFNVEGMHCNSCKLLLEKSLKKVKNVKKVKANVQQGTVTIEFDITPPDQQDIETIVEECWYKVTTKKWKTPWLSKDPKNYKIFGISLLGFFVLYRILSSTGLFDIKLNNSTPGLSLVLLIWLIAGFSSCFAVVGWLVLAIATKRNQNKQNQSFGQKIVPHLRFNIGRIVWFGLLWGILWTFGSIFKLSPTFMSFMTLAIGVIMILLGINLSNISPKLSHFSLTLPTWKWFNKGETEIIEHEAKSTELGKYIKAFGGGALTFFLPCGFTFAMQMYAIGTGSFWMGMTVMALFAIGTLPGLMSIGSLTSLFKGKKATIAYQAIGVLIILFGLYNFSNAFSVLKAKYHIGSSYSTTNTIDENTPMLSEIPPETIEMIYDESGLKPSVVNLVRGRKYKITIDVQTAIYGCMTTIYLPGLNEHYQEVKKGKTITFDIDAKRPGSYEFVCAAMGMPHGARVVIK